MLLRSRPFSCLIDLLNGSAEMVLNTRRSEIVIRRTFKSVIYNFILVQFNLRLVV